MTDRPDPPSPVAVLAALCTLRPPGAPLAPGLLARIGAPSVTAAEEILVAAVARPTTPPRVPNDASPALRFLARQGRRDVRPTGASLARPFSAVRLPARIAVASAVTSAVAGARFEPDPAPAAALATELTRLRRWRTTARSVTAELAVQLGRVLAARLVRSHLEIDASAWATLLRGVLVELDGPVRVIVHPDDLARVESALRAIGSPEAGIDLAGEPALEPGDLVVSASVGLRDLRVSTRLAALLGGVGA